MITNWNTTFWFRIDPRSWNRSWESSVAFSLVDGNRLLYRVNSTIHSATITVSLVSARVLAKKYPFYMMAQTAQAESLATSKDAEGLTSTDAEALTSSGCKDTSGTSFPSTAWITLRNDKSCISWWDARYSSTSFSIWSTATEDKLGQCLAATRIVIAGQTILFHFPFGYSSRL